jgi:hypothetical protein
MFEKILDFLGFKKKIQYKVILVYSETYNKKYLVKVRDYD